MDLFEASWTLQEYSRTNHRLLLKNPKSRTPARCCESGFGKTLLFPGVPFCQPDFSTGFKK
jgi:hypothetical protein